MYYSVLRNFLWRINAVSVFIFSILLNNRRNLPSKYNKLKKIQFYFEKKPACITSLRARYATQRFASFVFLKEKWLNLMPAVLTSLTLRIDISVDWCKIASVPQKTESTTIHKNNFQRLVYYFDPFGILPTQTTFLIHFLKSSVFLSPDHIFSLGNQQKETVRYLHKIKMWKTQL